MQVLVTPGVSLMAPTGVSAKLTRAFFFPDLVQESLVALIEEADFGY